MNTLFLVLSVLAFDFSNTPYPVRPGDEISIEHNKLQLHPQPLGPVEVIDAKGRNVVIRVDGDTVYMKAKERHGYPCGPTVVRSGGEEFKFRVRAHHGPVCEEHKH